MFLRFFILFFCLFLFGNDNYGFAKRHYEIYKTALPFRCNDNLTLTALLNVGDSILYKYRVNDTMSKPVSKFKDKKLKEYIKELKDIAIKNSCNDKVVLKLFDLGIKIEHLFYFEKAKLLFEFKMGSKECSIL